MSRKFNFTSHHFANAQQLQWFAILQDKLAALVRVANFGIGIVSLPPESETGQEIRKWTSDILPVQERYRHAGSDIPVSGLPDTLHISATHSVFQLLHKINENRDRKCHCYSFNRVFPKSIETSEIFLIFHAVKIFK